LEKADLLFRKGAVFTSDQANPWAASVAIRGTRIVAVGSDAEVEALRGPGTRVIDAGGRTVMPGFIDTHFHLLWGSLELADAQLGGITTMDELAYLLRKYASENPEKEWLAGQGMPYLILPDGASLDRFRLDAVITERPVALTTYDGHTMFANTEALKLAGLLHGGLAGPGSEIVMLPDGTASGELREGASRPVVDLIPEPDEAEKRALLHRGLKEAAALGITSIHNMDGDLDQLTRYATLEDAGELTLRVYVPFSVKPETVESQLEEAVEMARLNPAGMARGGAAKFFMDGVIESYTALMLDDYAGAPGNKGDALYSAEHFNRMATACDALGLQIFTHAIGDGAVRRTLDGYAAARAANGARDSRHRVEHLEVVHPDDLPRFVDLGVIAAMQPEHAPGRPDGADIWPARVGPERWDRSFAWRTVRDAGVRLVFGSDWPVVTQSPIRGIHAALNRKPWTPGGVDHSQTLEETLASYTKDAAYAEFMEGEKGMLRPGYLADLVMLSEDFFACPAEQVGRIRPVLTVVDGKVVFEKMG
jgi:hypothetical protein